MSDTPPTVEKVRRPRRRGWRLFFAIFKWCRVAALVLILCGVLALIFLHQAGLPVSLQDKLVARFRELGWDAQFGKLRLRWYSGLVAEQLALSRTNGGAGPNLFVETAEFRLNPEAMRSLRLQVDSLLLSEAKLIWPLAATNRHRHTLVLERVHGELLFHPDDRWELRALEGRALGINVRFRGVLTNASLVRDWRMSGPDLDERRVPGGETWGEILSHVKRVRPAVAPELSVQFAGDGRDPRTLEASLKLIAPGLDSPWGAATNVNLVLRLQPASTNTPMEAEFKLSAERPRMPWGSADHLFLSARWEPSLSQLLPPHSQCLMILQQMATPWGSAEQLKLETHTAPSTNGLLETTMAFEAQEPRAAPGSARQARLTARALHSPTNPLPASLGVEGELEHTVCRWATSAWTRVDGWFRLPALGDLRFFETNATWPERGTNLEASLTFVFTNAVGPDHAYSRVFLTNDWHGSVLRLGATAESPSGALAFNASLDTLTREAHLNTTLRAEPHQFARFLPTNARPWLAEFQSPVPLELQAAGTVTFPPWTQHLPDWDRDLLPTLSIAGRLETGPGSYRQVAFDGARAIGLYTNGQWTLPEMRVTRPEGTVEGEAFADTTSADFRVKATSSILPDSLRPAFGENVHRKVFDPFAFTIPPFVRADVRGNWKDWTTLTAVADLVVSNAAIRTQSIAFASARIEFTNRFISFLHPMILREAQRGDADGIGFDTRTERLYLTNAHGNLDAMAIAHALGPPIVRVLQPYVFDTPAHIRVHGLLPLRRGDNGEDAWFEVEGGPFHWWRFHADKVRAQIHWLGDTKTVTLTNLAARWRGSDAVGWMRLDFTRPRGGAMAFHIGLEGADLGGVVQDFQGGLTNRLEGTFGGELNVTDAMLDDLQSWQGHGRVELREGLLWDIPLFAVLSPMLNAVIPGLGHSRAREGRATFTITNSVIHSRDLQIRASAMQLKYRGAINFQGELDARMEAELFRNIPGVGVVLSKLLWPVTKLFEYRVTGTLARPKLDEMYIIPKVVLFPLQPIKTLRDLFGNRDKEKDKEPTKPPAPDPPP